MELDYIALALLHGQLRQTGFGDKMTRSTFVRTELGRYPARETNEQAVSRFHLSRGCCDGTDPRGCYLATEKTKSLAVTEAKRRAKNESENEYLGTEPTSCFERHDGFRMGDKCMVCGFVA